MIALNLNLFQLSYVLTRLLFLYLYFRMQVWVRRGVINLRGIRENILVKWWKPNEIHRGRPIRWRLAFAMLAAFSRQVSNFWNFPWPTAELMGLTGEKTFQVQWSKFHDINIFGVSRLYFRATLKGIKWDYCVCPCLIGMKFVSFYAQI